MTILDDLPILTRDKIIGVGTNAFLMRPKNQMRPLIERVMKDTADSRNTPGVTVLVKLRLGFDTGNWNFFLSHLLGNSHTTPAIQCQIVNFANDRRSLGVNDKMPFIVRVTLQSHRGLPAAKLSLAGSGHARCQHLFGNISAVHIVQDIFERCDVHFLSGQAVHPIGDGNIAHIVFREKDLDIGADFNIISAKPRKVLCDDATNPSGLNISNQALKRRPVEVAACIAVIHIIFMLEQSVLFGKLPKHDFLIADAHALVIAAVIERNTAIESGDFLVN